MRQIHLWWSKRLVERFWLAVVRNDGQTDVLATPCGSEAGIPTWRRRLILHVKPGDMVFHFDVGQQAIVAWSPARGRVRDCAMTWDVPTPGPAPAHETARTLPTWSMALGTKTALNAIVPLDAIARGQRALFPVLRTLEDEVGEPLYYPFTMSGAAATSLLVGHVFKLPAVFVEQFAPLANAARNQTWFRPPRATSSAMGRVPASVDRPGTERPREAAERHHPGAVPAGTLALSERD